MSDDRTPMQLAVAENRTLRRMLWAATHAEHGDTLARVAPGAIKAWLRAHDWVPRAADGNATTYGCGAVTDEHLVSVHRVRSASYGGPQVRYELAAILACDHRGERPPYKLLAALLPERGPWEDG